MKEIYLAGISVLSPLGADLEMVSLAMDAGISAYRSVQLPASDLSFQLALIPEEAFKPQLPTRFPGVSAPQIRLVQLAAAALNDLRPKLPKQALPLFLAGPEPYYQQIGFNGLLIKHLESLSRVPLERGSSRYFALGRAGGIEAVLMAFRYFEATGAQYCLIGGADTFYDPRTLGILEKRKRLADHSPDGFVPGEGASFALLASPNAPEAVKENSLARLHLPGLARERGHLFNGEPSSFEALAQAVKQALPATEEKVANIYSSQNGELHYVRELSIATIRHRRHLDTRYSVHRPAEFMGDLGAAFVPLALGIASRSRGLSLVCASSDSGPRAAICVS